MQGTICFTWFLLQLPVTSSSVSLIYVSDLKTGRNELGQEIERLLTNEIMVGNLQCPAPAVLEGPKLPLSFL